MKLNGYYLRERKVFFYCRQARVPHEIIPALFFSNATVIPCYFFSTVLLCLLVLLCVDPFIFCFSLFLLKNHAMVSPCTFVANLHIVLGK